MQCPKIIEFQVKFICNRHEEVKKAQSDDISNNKLKLFMNSMRKFLTGNEDERQTTQHLIRMKYLFRGISIIA